MDYIFSICIGITILPWMASKLCQFNELRKIVSLENQSLDCSSFKGFIDSTCKSVNILKTTVEVMVNQKFYSPQKLGGSKTCKFVDIYHNMKWYKVPFSIHRGPLLKEITSIKTEFGQDLTDDILPFAGPEHNFFGMGITPSFFNCEGLIIVCENQTYFFSRNTPIVFSEENLSERLLPDIPEETSTTTAPEETSTTTAPEETSSTTTATVLPSNRSPPPLLIPSPMRVVCTSLLIE